MAHFQMENLKKAASDDDKKRQEDKKQADVYESHSKFMKSKVRKKIYGWQIRIYKKRYIIENLTLPVFLSMSFVYWYSFIRCYLSDSYQVAWPQPDHA